MIQSKSDYLFYLEADRYSLERAAKEPSFADEIWLYQRLLRRVEYFYNCMPYGYIISKVYLIYLQTKLKVFSVILGFSIPINVFGAGLSIAHRGTIVVNGDAKVGNNCRIGVDTSIGTQAGFSNNAPEIGNNVYIGPGAKLFGKIVIADNIAIGANAVVNKSFKTSGVTIGGIPAKQISNKGSMGLLIKGTELVENDV